MMTRRLILFLALSLSLTQVFGANSGTSLPPNSHEIIKMIMSNLQLRLPVDEHSGCKISALPKYARAKDYVTFLLGAMASANTGSKKQLDVACQSPKDEIGKTTFSYWECHFAVILIADNGDPWNYGLRFNIDRHSNKILPNSLTCPGTP